ncbi:TDRD1 protein, partial [Rhinopomastus cyanomelas]|nr:TDRD1 protein [Rhinopomastus cyanomelas]
QVSCSDFSHEKPKKSQSPSEKVFSVGYNKNLFSSLTSPPHMKTCHHCGLCGTRRCSRCKQIYYCSTDCQKNDWQVHRVVCEPAKVAKKRHLNNSTLNITCSCFKQGISTSVDSLKRQNYFKKVMFSDLQPLEIKKAMEVQGTVTQLKSPNEFYMQMDAPEVLDQISKLSVKLQECYPNNSSEEQYIAVKGEVCAARCSLNQSWKRALVIDVHILQKKAQVFYVDYGNEENIPFSWIKALQKETELLFPPCAIKCSFAKEEAQKGGITMLSSQLVGKCCSVTIVDTLQEEMMLSYVVDVPLDLVLENHCEGSKEKTHEDEELLQSSISDAQCVSLSVGDTFSGVISFIQNPEDFFCQQIQYTRQLLHLQMALKEHCGKVPSSPAFRPAVGNVCCAQFTEDNLWYRAAVLAYNSEEIVLVGYIDYGNFEGLPLTRLRPMIPRLMDLPAQAIRCTLAGVKPPLGGWTPKAVSLMKQLVKDKVVTVKVVDKETYRSVVELVDTSVTPTINILSHLVEKGCAAEKSKMASPAAGMNDVKQANEDTTSKRIFRWSKLSLKQTVDVIVCVVYSPGEFYCQISNKNELLSLNLLNKSLSEYCQKTADTYKPQNGEPCCAFFSGDGNWYRALVENTNSDGTVKVCFVDYGNVEEVPLDKIRQISTCFLQLPFQGIKCWLSGIKPSNNKWIPEATTRFHMLTAGLKLQARVTTLSRDGAGVELIDNSTGHPRVISEILTSEQLAVKEVQHNKNNFPKEPDKQETSREHWKSIQLAVDESVSVCITEIVRPDLFYAVPVQMKDKEKLHQQLIELENLCKSCKQQSFKPKLGDACCAKSSGDDHWYRALVLQVSQSVVEVLFADYGNTETLPLSKVLPIPDSYLKLPFQTITCSLAGVEKAGWSPVLLDKLKEMILHKHVTITVKETVGNVNLVTVEKPCESGTVNVAEKLALEGMQCSCDFAHLLLFFVESGGETKCCCRELKMQLKKHEQVLLFLLNSFGNPDGFTEMKKLLD